MKAVRNKSNCLNFSLKNKVKLIKNKKGGIKTMNKNLLEIQAAFVLTNSAKAKEKIQILFNDGTSRAIDKIEELTMNDLENFAFIYCENDDISAQVQQRIINYFF